MRTKRFVAWAGTGLCAVFVAASSVMAAPCSRFETRGLAPGMTSKQVWSVMGGKGQQSEVVVQGRGQRSIAQYVIDGAVIEVEYDGVVTRKRQALITRVETRRSERDVAYKELVRSLVETVGQQPVGGLPVIDGERARWVDAACQVEVTASRHVPDWWEPGQGPTVHVEVRSLSRATADLLSRDDQRREAAKDLGSSNAPESATNTQASGTRVAIPGVNNARTADTGNAGNGATDKPDTRVAARDGEVAPGPIPIIGAGGLEEAPPPAVAAARPEPVPPSAAAAPAANEYGADFQAPVALYNPAPRYPDAARILNLGGNVVLEVLVNEQGRVDDIIVSSSKANKILLDVAKRAVRRWRYEPAMKDGVPVSMWTTVAIGFDRPRP